MLRMTRLALLAGVLIFGSFGVCPAQPPVADTQEASSHQLEPLKVTAGKTEGNIQKIPISSTALPGMLIEDADINDTNELIRFAPNVYFKKSTSENVISMRGVTSFDSSIVRIQGAGCPPVTI